MNLFPRLIRAIWETVCEKSSTALLKSRIGVLKLDLSYYVCVYERFAREVGFRRREATMPLDFQPKLDKIVELLLYLAHKRPGADKYQAVKFLYLADREHLRRYGRPITFEHYYAMWFGPVASNALDFIHKNKWTMDRAGLKSLPFETEAGTVKMKSGKTTETVFIRKPLREVNSDLFSKSDLQVFDEIIAKYKNASFDDLFNETHKHHAYKRAWENRPKGAERADMLYDEMVEDKKRRAELVEDISPIAAHLK